MTQVTLTRIEHESVDGRWTLVRRAPAPALSRYVLGYEGYLERGGRPVWRREAATPVVPLIINVDAPWDIGEVARPHEARAFARSFVAGLHDRPVLVGSRGRALCLQVDLTPLGALRLLAVPMQSLAGRTVELADVVGSFADELEDLFDTPGWAARFDALDRLLLKRLAEARPTSHLVVAAWGAIERSGGQVSVGALARGLDTSRKHLDALFRHALGMSPKRLARLHRFARALERLSGSDASLAEVAQACGYYDQAHLNRDFRAFAGEAPLAHLSRHLEDGTGAIER